MAFKSILINPKDDFVSVIHLIKNTKDREILFVMKKGTNILYSSENLRLIRKTGEVLGKKIKVAVDSNDEIGQQIARKAGILEGDEGPVVKNSNLKNSRIKRSDILQPVGDIKSNKSKIIPKRAVLKAKVAEIVPQTPVEVSGSKETIFSGLSEKITSVKDNYFSNQKFDDQSSDASQKRLKNSTVVKIFLISIFTLVVAVLLVSIFLPSAKITIYARSEPVARDVDVTIDQNIKALDVEGLMVQGTVVSKEMAKTKTFPMTGVRLDGLKAQGTVRLYNFTQNTLTLRQSTTTLIFNGKKYFFTKDVTGLRPTLRKTSDAQSEVDPNSLIAEIEIIAENPGETYNLPANTKFTIVNTALGDREVYAMNEKAIGGGQASAATVLSQADIDQATSQIVSDMFNELENEIGLAQSGKVKIMTVDGVEVLAKTPNKDVGDSGENFDMTVIARISGLAYKEADINSLLQQKIQNILSADKYLVEDARKNITIKEKSYDKIKGLGVISVHYETTVAYRINTASLSKILTGKTESEIKEILLTKPEIDQVLVDFSPFFVHKSPRFANKIKLIPQIAE
jgi:hypothetical protein